MTCLLRQVATTITNMETSVGPPPRGPVSWPSGVLAKMEHATLGRAAGPGGAHKPRTKKTAAAASLPDVDVSVALEPTLALEPMTKPLGGLRASMHVADTPRSQASKLSAWLAAAGLEEIEPLLVENGVQARQRTLETRVLAAPQLATTASTEAASSFRLLFTLRWSHGVAQLALEGRGAAVRPAQGRTHCPRCSCSTIGSASAATTWRRSASTRRSSTTCGSASAARTLSR